MPDNHVEIFVMASETLKKYTPDTIREILKQHNTDDELAAIMAAVSNETGWLRHDTDDPDNDEETVLRIIAELDAWRKLEEELFDEIIRRLEEENRRKDIAYITAGIGLYNASNRLWSETDIAMAQVG